PGTCPARKGVGLVITHVTNRFIRPGPSGSRQGSKGPLAIPLDPVEGSLPSSGLARGPTVGQPQLGPLVTAVVDEGQVLGMGHQPAGKSKTMQEGLVARRFVVEREAVSIMSDLAQPFGKSQPTLGWGSAMVQRRFPVHGLEGIGSEGVFEVRKDQL